MTIALDGAAIAQIRKRWGVGTRRARGMDA
jgi:hypothetical protein